MSILLDFEGYIRFDERNLVGISNILQRKYILLGQKLRKQVAAEAAVLRLFKREALQNRLYNLDDSKNVSISYVYLRLMRRRLPRKLVQIN